MIYILPNFSDTQGIWHFSIKTSCPGILSISTDSGTTSVWTEGSSQQPSRPPSKAAQATSGLPHPTSKDNNSVYTLNIFQMFSVKHKLETIPSFAPFSLQIILILCCLSIVACNSILHVVLCVLQYLSLVDTISLNISICTQY